MMIKKMTTNSGEGIMIIAQGDNPTKFPVGFSYMLGNVIRTVIEVVTKNANEEMRKIHTSDGAVEITPLDTIEKDLKSFDCKIISTGVAEPVKVDPPVVVEQPKVEETKTAEVQQEKRGRGRPRKQK